MWTPTPKWPHYARKYARIWFAHDAKVAKIGRELREYRSPKSQTFLKYGGKCARIWLALRENVRANLVRARREIFKKMCAKFETSTKFGADMAKRVSQMHYYGEERNSVKVQLKDMVKRESLAEVRKTIPAGSITFWRWSSQNNSSVENNLLNLAK